MEQFGHISAQETKEHLDNGTAVIVDIRDDAAFESAHIPSSQQLNNGTLAQFVNNHEADTPVIVCCYHGHSSQQAAQYLLHQGIKKVYSMDGGFEAWRANYAFVSGVE